MKLRIVEWSQAVYADMPEKCWTIVDEKGRDVAGTFWDKTEAEDYLRAMSTPDEIQRDEAALRQADPTIRHPEGI